MVEELWWINRNATSESFGYVRSIIWLEDDTFEDIINSIKIKEWVVETVEFLKYSVIAKKKALIRPGKLPMFSYVSVCLGC